MVVTIESEPDLNVGMPEPLIESVVSTDGGSDVTADGRRFLVVQPPEQNASVTHLNVVLNWFEELRRLVPGS
jgi:hypothetical protein